MPGVRTRYMDGIASRLHAHHVDRQHKRETGISVPYRRWSLLDLGAEVGDGGDYGTVRVWRTVVLNPGEANPAREFAPASRAEAWMLNGQTHNTRSDRHFASKRIGLDALVGHLTVEVELDGLTADAKSLIVTTGRHSRAHRRLGDRLEEAIDRVLAEDDELKALNRQIRDEAFRKASNQQIQGLDRALKAFGLMIRRKRKVRRREDEPGGPRPRPNPKPLEPISPLHPHPTDVFQFRTVLRQTVKTKRGHRGSALLEVDAVDGYFDGGLPTSLSLQFVPDLGEKLRIVSIDSLESGRMRIRFRASKDAPLTTTQLVASCLPPTASLPLTASIPVELIAEPSQSTSHGKGRTKTKVREEEIEEEGPPPVVVAYEHATDAGPSWADSGLSDWTYETIGSYRSGVAYINGDYADLRKLRAELPRERHPDITHVYIAPLAMTLVGLAESENNAPKDDDNNEIMLHAHFRNAALRSAALSSLFAIRYMNKSGLLDLSSNDGED